MLVQSHLRSAPKLAAGVASLPDGGQGFAATQAAWRFMNNERVRLSDLAEPLREVGRTQVEGLEAPFALLVHDWCKLKLDRPTILPDRAQLTHETDIGYDLTSALLVSADDGRPIAPMEMHLRTADGVLSTRSPAPEHEPHLEQVLPTMQAAAAWRLSKPLVHVIDREADSVDHYRRWDQAGHRYLVRADDRRVNWRGRSALLSEIATELRHGRKFSCTGTVKYEGQSAQLWVAQTEVVLDRPAKKNVNGRKYSQPGRPLTLRLVVVQVRKKNGKLLAGWLLLSNVPAPWADAEKLARCDYWRWRIESFFKLLKSHGQQLESWLQRTSIALARRLLVASMACVLAWQLQAAGSPSAQRLRDIVMQLSGRQTKRGIPATAPALLAGLWSLFATLALLEHHDLDELKNLASTFLDTG